jgi:hypothetical protein
MLPSGRKVTVSRQEWWYRWRKIASQSSKPQIRTLQAQHAELGKQLIKARIEHWQGRIDDLEVQIHTGAWRPARSSPGIWTSSAVHGLRPGSSGRPRPRRQPARWTRRIPELRTLTTSGWPRRTSPPTPCATPQPCDQFPRRRRHFGHLRLATSAGSGTAALLLKGQAEAVENEAHDDAKEDNEKDEHDERCPFAGSDVAGLRLAPGAARRGTGRPSRWQKSRYAGGPASSGRQ